MQELEKILEEIDETIERYGENPYIDEKVTDLCYGLNIAKDIIRKHMNDGWIPVEERLPEEKVSPESQDFYEYQVTANFGFGESVRTYKYGNGHWWHGPGIVDEYVVAWREHPEPYRPERGGGRMKYKCANEFYIEIYDETWMPTGEYKTIPAGTIWELDESTNNIGGEVHLDNDDEGWIEISRDTFEECFEEVRE